MMKARDEEAEKSRGNCSLLPHPDFQVASIDLRPLLPVSMLKPASCPFDVMGVLAYMHRSTARCNGAEGEHDVPLFLPP
jgi:hypothetical protein